jgi:hypothetical protein
LRRSTLSRSSLSTWLVAVLASIVMSGCETPGDGSLGSCASAYVGTFSGDMQGDLLVQVNSDGFFEALLVKDDGEVLTGAGDVTDAGELDPTTTGLALRCSIDLDECACSGDWITDEGSNFETTGMFEMSIRSH